MSTNSHPRSPTMPMEMVYEIIDHLHSDIRALGVCALVCSDWLPCSRHHIFSTLHLWPRRVRPFIDLARSPKCTFTPFIGRLEMDGDKPQSPHPNDMAFSEAVEISRLSCLSKVHSLRLRNLDWTSFSPPDQSAIRQRLAVFTQLKTLELDAVLFHDLREVVRIISSFPLLQRLSAQIQFSKYIEHAVSSALTLRLPVSLQTIELSSEDAIPVFLSCLSAREANDTSAPQFGVHTLTLRSVTLLGLRHVRDALRMLGPTLRHLHIGLSKDIAQSKAAARLIEDVGLSCPTNLRSICIGDVDRTAATSSHMAIEASLLAQISSPCVQDVRIGIRARTAGDLDNLDWHDLDRVLVGPRFLGLEGVWLEIVYDSGAASEIEAQVRKALPNINARGTLRLCATRAAARDAPLSLIKDGHGPAPGVFVVEMKGL